MVADIVEFMTIPPTILLCARVYASREAKVYVINDGNVYDDDEVMETYRANRVCNRERGHDGQCGDGKP